MRLAPVLLTALLLLGIASPDVRAAGPPCPIVFCRQDAVMLMTPDGAMRKLGNGRDPALAPGASRAVWIEDGQTPEITRIALWEARTGAVTTLASPGGAVLSPRWSPDGSTVCFTRMPPPGGPDELWTVTPGSPPKLVARAAGAAGDSFFSPAWTPDSGEILYHDMNFLHRIRPDGGPAGSTPLTTLHASQLGFTSADRFIRRPGGEQILFSAPVEGTKAFQRKVPDVSSALFVFDPASGVSRRITPENVTAFDPAWTPDGEEALFTGYTDAQAGARHPFRLWRVRPGSAPVEICPGASPMPPSGR